MWRSCWGDAQAVSAPLAPPCLSLKRAEWNPRRWALRPLSLVSTLTHSHTHARTLCLAVTQIVMASVCASQIMSISQTFNKTQVLLNTDITGNSCFDRSLQTFSWTKKMTLILKITDKWCLFVLLSDESYGVATKDKVTYAGMFLYILIFTWWVFQSLKGI